MSLARVLLLLAVAALPIPLAAQTVPVRDAAVRSALDRLRADNEWTLTQQVELCQIPAPPFKEAARAAEFLRRLTALGLTNGRIDAEGNVIAERAGTGPGPRVVLSAHLDTVFPEGTDVTVTRTGTRFSGPGIGDDCRGLAVLLGVARVLREQNVRHPGTLVFVGTVGEEGAGNLRGVRRLFAEKTAGEIDFFISVDGTGLGLTHVAVGSHRYRVTFHGPGGHSYGAFGMPNPIHALGRAIAHLSETAVPMSPRTTFSVGIIEGGTSVNSISMDAAMEVDLRSVSQAELDVIDVKLQSAVQRALWEERARWPRSKVPLDVRIEEIGKRPAGAVADTAFIVRAANAAGRALGFTPEAVPSSTDSNIPISLGVPAVTIDGGGSGRGAHSASEWYDDGAEGWRGPQWALLLVTTLLGGR